MHSTIRAAATAGLAFAAAVAAPGSGATVIDFETPAITGAVAEMPGGSFAAQGVQFSTVRLSGTVAVGGVITLAPINGDMRLYRDATAISGEQLAGPALGGTANDLLMRFDQPITSLALTSDDAIETANPIRLLALAPTAEVDRYTVLAFAEGLDDAVAPPANLLAVAPSASFSVALFEVRSQQEGFDDLTFTFAAAPPPETPPAPPPDPTPTPVAEPTAVPTPSSLAMLAGALGSVAAARRQVRLAARRV